MSDHSQIRVRFAPSPTGTLHIGGARTALFNYLFARRHRGKFLLRIEDTDAVRSNQEMTDQILRSLTWLGLDWDEAPVYQSIHRERHIEICKALQDKGLAYPCFCTAEELQARRKSQDGVYQYDRKCRDLSKEAIQENMEKNVPYVLRFRVPDGQTEFPDGVRGTVIVQHQEIDDFVILRSDGSPVYQMAVVVDDHDMAITHVIRGDDHLSNTPKQILLYQAMGWSLPKFAHVPMILGPDKKRLSKRHGATSVEEYRENGILSHALTNFLALMGWSPGNDQELLTLDEMTSLFSIDRITKNPAVFDDEKLIWMNSQYLKETDIQILIEILKSSIIEKGWIDESSFEGKQDYITQCLNLMIERMKTVTDFMDADYFFEDPETYEEKAKAKHWLKEGALNRLIRITEILTPVTDWSADRIEAIMRGLAEALDVGAGKVIHPTRLAITGSGASPGLFELMEVLGKEVVIRRLQTAIKYLKEHSEG